MSPSCDILLSGLSLFVKEPVLGFPIGILGQVWYLIVSILDLSLLLLLVEQNGPGTFFGYVKFSNIFFVRGSFGKFLA